MIVDNLDFRGISLLPYKTDSVLIVDSNAVLPEAIALQSLQVVAASGCKVAELAGRVQCFQLSPCRAFDMPESWYILLFEESFGVGIAKALDHKGIWPVARLLSSSKRRAEHARRQAAAMLSMG
ncbi:MAG: hypothetical protein WBY93_19490 [Candidatus Binatus sp.]